MKEATVEQKYSIRDLAKEAGVHRETARLWAAEAELGREDESGQMEFTEAEFQLLRQRKKLSFQEAGKRGGCAVARSRPRSYFQAIGKAGGTTTKQRLGRAHYQQIGQKGAQKAQALRIAQEGA